MASPSAGSVIFCVESVSASFIRTAVAIGLGAKKIFFGGGERLDSVLIESLLDRASTVSFSTDVFFKSVLCHLVLCVLSPPIYH